MEIECVAGAIVAIKASDVEIECVAGNIWEINFPDGRTLRLSTDPLLPGTSAGYINASLFTREPGGAAGPPPA